MTTARPFLVYRDRLGAPSELGFLRRQYVGFTRLQPVWTGRTILPGAEALGPHRLRIGGDDWLAPVRRMLFQRFGVVAWPASAELAPVLHAQFARGGALALPLARALGTRLVVTLHGGDISKRKNWRRHAILARRWDGLVRRTACFVSVSEAVAEMAAARGVPAGKLRVLPIGVECPERPPVARPPEAFLFVGRFVEKKGVAVLARAVRQLRGDGDTTPVVCVGDGPLRPVLERLARDAAEVTLTGWLPAEDVRARMAGAFALLVPSTVAGDGDAEGLPSVIPEAMAQAVPVIGSGQGGIMEAIRHGETGLLVPPGDPAALADAMRRIRNDAMLRRRVGLAGFQAAQADLNAAIQSRKLEALLLST